ncbi:MAG: CsbD family protein [Myxococcales bacterium]
MDKKHVEGTADEVKGRIKESAGALTGDRQLQGEGRLDQVKGAVKDKIGNIKEAFRKDFDPDQNKG